MSCGNSVSRNIDCYVKMDEEKGMTPLIFKHGSHLTYEERLQLERPIEKTNTQISVQEI